MPRFLGGKVQRPIAGFGNFAANTADKDRGSLTAKYGRSFLQNIGPIAPSGPGHPALPLRHPGLVRAHSLSAVVADYTDSTPVPIEFTVGPFSSTIDQEEAAPQFFAVGGGASFLVSQGLIPAAGTMVSVAFEITQANLTDIQVDVYKNGVALGGTWTNNVPPGGPYGVATMVGGEVFNGTTDVLDIVVTMLAPEEGGAPYTFTATATFTGSALTPATSVDVMVYSPSNRLRLALYGTFEPGPNSGADSFVDGSDFTQYFGAVVPSWQVRAMSINPRTTREGPLQLAYPATGTSVPLPDSYEMDTAAKLLRVRLFLAGANFVSNANFPASWKAVVYATWEPNIPVNSDSELDGLYAACHLVPARSVQINFGES